MKKFFALLLVASLILCMTGCGATGSDTANANVDELQQRIDELEAENAELREQLAEYDAAGSVSADIAAPENSAQPDAQPDAQSAEIGTAYTITDLCEFTVVYADLKKEVLPPNPDSYYTYYSEKDGMTYLDVAVSVKNLRTTARTADEFGTAKAVCGAGYEYTGFSIIEENGGGNFTYTNITNIAPLETAVLHYLISIPNELADDASVPISLELTMLDCDYVLTVR